MLLGLSIFIRILKEFVLIAVVLKEANQKKERLLINKIWNQVFLHM